MNPDLDEDTLNFARAVRNEFDFVLEAPYSYSLVAEEVALVRYESASVDLRIFRDPVTGELEATLRRTTIAEPAVRPFNVADVIRLTDPELAQSSRAYVARSPSSMQRGIRELAEQVREYGEPALQGSSTFFELMSAARALAVRDFAADIANRAAREKADQAWAASDYAGVVEAYTSAQSLTRADTARLEIARRHVDKGT